MRKSNLLNIVHMYNSEIESVYEEQMLDCKRIYSQSWSRVLHYVLEIDKPLSQQRTLPEMNNMAAMKLKDKDRQNIKDKFSVSLPQIIIVIIFNYELSIEFMIGRITLLLNL